MKSINKKKTERKRQKNARKKQRENKIHRPKAKKPLTEEQKEQKKQAREARKKKKEHDISREECCKIKRITKAITSVLSLDSLNQLAGSTKFIQRTREIKALPFVYVISFMFFGNGTISLEMLASSLKQFFNVDITPCALCKKINKSTTVVFLSEIVKMLLQAQLETKLPNMFSETFSMFSEIKLQDSSQITLHESLAKEFKGSNRRGSKSSLKLDFIYDIANLVVNHLNVTHGTTSDQSLGSDMLKYVKKKTLVIRDLGYFSLPVLKKIAKIGGYYLSRLSIKTSVYLNKDDSEPLNIPEYLKKQLQDGKSSINIPVYVGKKERLETRLVAEQVPKSVQNQRTRRFKKERGKEASAYYTEWSGFSIFITNIPVNVFSGNMIISIYKIRWQIELIFKNIKSNIELDVMKGTNKYRIESLLYGKLITVLVTFIISNYAAHVAQDREVSGDKVVKWLKCGLRLCVAILEKSLSDLLRMLEKDILRVCKQKRKRKTTREQLMEQYKQEMIVKGELCA